MKDFKEMDGAFMADGLQFTNEEFELMLKEILDPKGASYDTMFKIVDKTLTDFVCRKTNQYKIQNQWEDILQDIRLKVFQNIISGFLRKKGQNTVNDDPVWFQCWLYTIAKNQIKNKYADAVEEQTVIYDPGFSTDEELKDIDPKDPTNPYAIFDNNATLTEVVDFVLTDNTSIYIRLAWLAWSIYFFEMRCARHKISEKIVQTFEQKTLNEMYSMILDDSKKIEWFVVSEQRSKKIVKKLEATRNNGKTMGESKFREFFMKTGGVASISNWIPRMNEKIREELGDPDKGEI